MPNEETQPEKTEETAGKTFTQEEVDALIKKRLARAKSDVPSDYEELKKKATKFDELQNANKTELEKANEELGRLRADIAQRDETARIQKLKDEVSKETGVPVSLISGTTKEEMETFAQDVAEYAKKDSAPVLKKSGKFAHGNNQDNDGYAEILRQLKG